jgi:hypothetical protein
MAGEGDVWNKTYYHRVIRTNIGSAMKMQYEKDLARPLPHNLLTLLMQLTEQQNAKRRPARKTPAR